MSVFFAGKINSLINGGNVVTLADWKTEEIS
jgi:hypothetical protein